MRFVQIYSGGMENQLSWDGHADIKGNHEQFAGETDKPVAGLLADLEQRGLLDETLVIWGGEFGRLPIAQTGEKPGRDHNPHALHLLAGRRRRQGGRQPRRNRRDRLPRGRRPRPHQRPARDDPPPARPRPRAPDLQIQRPPIPPDRRRRQGDPQDPRVIRDPARGRATSWRETLHEGRSLLVAIAVAVDRISRVLTIVDRDLFQAKPRDLLATQVVMTIIDGAVVHGRTNH